MGAAKTAHQEKKEKAKRASVREILLRHGLKPKNLEVGLVKLAAIQKQHAKIVRLVKEQQKADWEASNRKLLFGEAQDALEAAEERVLAAYKDLDRIAGDDDLKEEMPLFAGETKTPGELRPIPADEGWKTVGLAGLKDPAIPAGLLKRLDAAGIGTLGDLAAHQEKHPDFPLSYTVTGVGEVSQGKIEAAVDAFWKRRATAVGTTTEQKALAGDPTALGNLAEGDKGKPDRRRRRSALKGGLQE